MPAAPPAHPSPHIGMRFVCTEKGSSFMILASMLGVAIPVVEMKKIASTSSKQYLHDVNSAQSPPFHIEQHAQYTAHFSQQTNESAYTNLMVVQAILIEYDHVENG